MTKFAFCLKLGLLGSLLFASVAQAGDLQACYARCDQLYSECQADQQVTDKTVCHNNRNTCTVSCNDAVNRGVPPTSGTGI